MKAQLQRKFAMVTTACLLVAGAGAVLMALGYRKYQERETFRNEAWVADGVVTGFAYEAARSGDTKDATLYAMVRFELEGGEEIVFQGPAHNGIIDLREEDLVRVLYDPADPTRARVDSFLGMWVAPTLFWVAGGVMILMALLTFWETWRWAEQHQDRGLPEINRLPWRP